MDYVRVHGIPEAMSAILWFPSGRYLPMPIYHT
jgi:hypothetical protein